MPEHQPQPGNTRVTYTTTSIKKNRAFFYPATLWELEIIPEDHPNWRNEVFFTVLSPDRKINPELFISNVRIR